MKRKPPSETARRTGRPPLRAGARTIKTTVRFDEATILRICGLVGRQGMADFVRRATEALLEREEAEAEEDWNRAMDELRGRAAGTAGATNRPPLSDVSRKGN